MAYRVQFDGWDFETNGFIVSTLEVELEESAEPAKSSAPDAAASPETSSAGLRITVGGTVAGELGSPASLQEAHSAFLVATRGIDRLKRGQLEVYDGRHYWAQRLGTVKFSFQQGAPASNWSASFYADDPHSRGNDVSSVMGTVSDSDPTLEVQYGVDFFGNASRIPLILTSGLTWLAGEVFRVRNLTAGWIFEKVLEDDIATGEQLVIDGELHEVLERGESMPSGISGTMPYLRGGVTNVLDFTGSDRLGAIAVAFMDRAMA